LRSARIWGAALAKECGKAARARQVAALMRDPARARARSQLPRAQAPRPLCHPADSVRPPLAVHYLGRCLAPFIQA